MLLLSRELKSRFGIDRTVCWRRVWERSQGKIPSRWVCVVV